jgi:flagellin FlaB
MTSQKKGEMGVGTLIMFIAMILAVAIAATVLIQTGTSLQNKALATGNAVRDAISTNVRVLDITRQDGPNSSVTLYQVQIKLAAGSEGIDLRDGLLSLDGTSEGYELTYTDGSCTFNQTNGYYTDELASNGTFTVRYLIKSGRHSDGYFFDGEIAQLCFAFIERFADDRLQRAQFVPRDGLPITFGRR